MEQDREFVEFVVKSLVTNPEAVEVTRETDELGVLLTIKCDPQDMGLVIGRQGSTIQAVRLLVKNIGMRNHSRVNIKVFDPKNPHGVQYVPAGPGPMKKREFNPDDYNV